MKKVFDKRVYIKLEGWKNYKDTSIFKHLQFLSEEKAIEKIFCIRDFKELVEEVENGWICNAEMDETFFKHRPKVVFRTADLLNDSFSITEKDFASIEIKIEYVEVKDISLKALSEMLSADDFVEYLKNKEISLEKFL